MALPLLVLLAYCSGPNNTQTSATNGYDSTAPASSMGSASDTGMSMTATATTAYNDSFLSTTTSYNSINNPLPSDTSDLMYRHFQRVNGQNWTWDMNYPGFDRPAAGSYNAAINGNWKMMITPQLVSAWKRDNSQELWSSGYAFDGTYIGAGNTYVSASESFGTTDSAATGAGTTANTMDVNSINYKAANGNMYQLPYLNLYLDNSSFTGFTGCNAISGRVSVSGNSLRFLNTTPATNVDCMGGFDQQAFLSMLSKIDSYAFVGDELQLMQGNQVLLSFKRTN